MSPGFQVWFAPDDDVLSVELGEIRRVTQGFLAADAPDPDDYAIRYAVYNLRNPDIVAALIQARRVGVSVQVLLDADQLDPARDWNTADEALLDAGFTFAPDHRDLTPGEAEGVELLGIAGSGLMHLKTRLYRTPEETVLLTGSFNPGDNALLNEETLHRTTSTAHPAVVEAYEDAYVAVMRDEHPENAWLPGSPVNVLFGPRASGPSAGTTLFDWISAETEQILITSYSLRDFGAPGHDAGLVALLCSKAAADIPVVVLTDQGQSDAWGDDTEDDLRSCGVIVYEATNLTTEFTSMHAKSVVLGRSAVRVVTDTANLTAAGFGTATRQARNIESTLFLGPDLEGGRIGRRYLAEFLRVADRYAWQSEDGDPPYAELERQLLAAPDWPRIDVQWSAQAYTTFGETVRVLGDRPELGVWGSVHLGIPLATDPETYPAWVGAPVQMPVGARVAWKLAAVGDGIRWEAGEDRVDHLVPPSGADDVALQATWR